MSEERETECLELCEEAFDAPCEELPPSRRRFFGSLAGLGLALPLAATNLRAEDGCCDDSCQDCGEPANCQDACEGGECQGCGQAANCQSNCQWGCQDCGEEVNCQGACIANSECVGCQDACLVYNQCDNCQAACLVDCQYLCETVCEDYGEGSC